MIIYDSKIARLLQGRLNPYDYVTLPLVTLTALPYGEKGIWEEMEMSIHRRQYTECFCVSLLPSLLLGWQVCWGFAALPLFAYYLLYWAERLAVGHSAFDYEAAKRERGSKLLRGAQTFRLAQVVLEKGAAGHRPKLVLLKEQDWLLYSYYKRGLLSV